MKRMLTAFLALLLTLTFLAGCTEKQEIVIDTDTLSSSLSALYGGGAVELAELSKESYDIRYGLDGLYVSLYAEASIVVTSDEFIVLEAENEEDAKKAFEVIDTYRKDRAKLFKSYAPDEVPKLNGALLARAGKYVVFASAPEDIVKEARRIWKEKKG
ncbi:MAG: DUF4358 domain-containing protein [Ruminococcaceae bacterium]|nr:DUF4358 domain-containing protein [Oscillospiraceae bacterium]